MKNTNTQKHQTFWKILFIAGITLFALVSLIVWHAVRHPREIDARMRAQAALLLDIAENGLRAHLRADRYHPDHIADMFTGLTLAASLGGVRLSDGDSRDMMAVGPFYMETTTAPRHGYIEVKRALAELEDIQPRGWRRGAGPRSGPGPGMGMGWLPLPPGPYSLTLMLDAAPWRTELLALRARTLLLALLTLLCGLSLITVTVYRDNQTRLRDALETTHKRGQRQAMLAQLGAGLAHETKNPLGIIRGLAQGIRDRAGGNAELLNRALEIIDETDRVAGELDRFLSFAKPIEPQREAIALDTALGGVVKLLQDEAASANIRMTLDAPSTVIIADKALLRRLLLNLALNAFKACATDCCVQFFGGADPSGGALIAVRDTGCGIAPEDLPQVTKPYFTRFSDGVGLGLALAEEIVQAHGWRLEISSTPDQGTEVKITGIQTVKDTA